MNIINHRVSRVKQDAPQSKRHRSTQESMKAFLGRQPLPPELAPFQSAIEKFPNVGALLSTLFGLMQAGFTIEQIGAALDRVATHAEQEAQRCPACLNWTDDGTTWGYTHKGSLHLLTVCPACVERITTGRPTAAMTRNLTAYVKAGAA